MKNNTKPKALIFHHYLPPWRIDIFNAMATYYELTIAFTDAEIEGFTYNREGLLEMLDPNIQVFFLNKGFKIGKRPIRYDVYSLLKRICPDIVFSHEYSPTSILVTIFKKLKCHDFRYVITTSDNLFIVKKVSGVKAFFRRFVLNNADALIVYSEKVRQWYKEYLPKLRIEVCPNIQNPKTLLAFRFSFGELITCYKKKFGIKDERILMFIGRLEHVKGLDLLLNAFAKSENKNFKLVLVGEGNEKGNLEQICKELDIGHQVVFPGFYSGKELYVWYEMADLFVLPSRLEAFGAVVNEALVFGCPVMASQYIGATEFLNKSNGILFDPLNQKEFVNTLNLFYTRFNYGSKIERKNLMPLSFEDYFKVFLEVNTNKR